jgi:hypothetical protein
VESVTTIWNQPAFIRQIIQFLLNATFFALFASLTIFAQAQLSTSDDEKTLTVNDAPEMEVYAIGKSVIVKGRTKGVLAFGGDVIVEGRVDGDVATIGGSIIQRSDAYIGGDVIAFGGAYKPDAKEPLREAGKETIMYGAFEEELRNVAQNPTQIFSPTLSFAFFAQRLLSVLFWFVVTLGITTLAPGAVSRAVARIQLSALRVAGIGFAMFLITTVCTIISIRFLPDYLSVILGLMIFFLMIMSYVFGRVAMQVSFGKMIQKRFFSERQRSETIAILLGVLIWTVLLSIPYLWTIALLTLFAAGIGLVVTARSKSAWQKQ